MIVNDHILLWDYASIKVLDVRHTMLRAGEALRSYRLPASMFLLAARGGAQVLLDEMEFEIKRYQVVHSGKGTHLDITLREEEFEYYMIFYKATMPLPSRQEMLRLLERSNPFHLQYSFSPNQPVSLFDKIKLMDQEWRHSGSLERLQVKSLFYQFVYSIMQQFYEQGVDMKEPDLAAQAILYLKDHYTESINLELLAESLNYSVPHFSALFKKRTGYSPIDYLIRIRIDKAANLLVETDATLREIAASVGYKDPYYLSRLFKKIWVFPLIDLESENGLGFKQKIVPLNSSDPPLLLGSFSVILLMIIIINITTRRFTYVQTIQINHCGNPIALHSLAAQCLFWRCFKHKPSKRGNTSVSTPQSLAQTNSSHTDNNLQTKLVSTINGDIQIPLNPKRIVVDQYLGSFIALGVIPIGTPGLHRKNPYLAKALAEVQDIGDVSGISVEKVIDLQPDLIITGFAEDESRYEKFSKIAPTVSVPYGKLKNAHEELTFLASCWVKKKKQNCGLPITIVVLRLQENV